MAVAGNASARGLSNRRRGIAYMKMVAEYLRASGWWPYASLENRTGSHDIFGVGDLGLEVTLDSWDQIAVKMIQAKRDAASRGLWRWAVIKRKAGQGNPANHYAVTEAGVFLRMAWELQQAELIAAQWDGKRDSAAAALGQLRQHLRAVPAPDDIEGPQ
jgi:hypothetical protein